MKQLEPFVVTQPLLNELNTLAAPSMLAAAVQAAFAELGNAYPDTLDLYGYSAEFKEGAREGDTVQLALEETAGVPVGNREFDIYFSKNEKLGRVGKWRLVFARRTEARPLSYSLDQANADGRTDSQLWRPQLAIATGDRVKDGQSLLWLAGQSARAYMKRLDAEFAAGNSAIQLQDDLDTRNYGGIVVVMQMAGWPKRRGNPALRPRLPASSGATDAGPKDDLSRRADGGRGSGNLSAGNVPLHGRALECAATQHLSGRLH